MVQRKDNVGEPPGYQIWCQPWLDGYQVVFGVPCFAVVADDGEVSHFRSLKPVFEKDEVQFVRGIKFGKGDFCKESFV